MTAADFSAIPILDYSLASNPQTKREFISQLQHALINIGFLYLCNPPVNKSDTEAIIRYAPRLFELPEETKQAIGMVNSPHFLGYSRLGSELTKGRVDQREQYDFATEHVNRWVEGDPEFMKLWGPAQVGLVLVSELLLMSVWVA
jgi:isopenicillin N synthase-like dioxygenase